MDKNTITGLVLIGLLLVVFSYLSRPTAEQREAQQRYYDSLMQVQQHEEELRAKQEATLANERQQAVSDSTATFFAATQGTDQKVTL
ncbi:MAG: membrane protein insertase YidC, partial [Bacteroidaceae bacterium]|nr:membrane protein insertase YidC [Bacteroidaceae bacterium]